MTSFSERPQSYPSIAHHRNPCKRRMTQRYSEPRFRRKLKRSTYEIANHVCVTHHQSVCILLLIGLSSVEILPEGSFNASSIFEKLLREHEKKPITSYIYQTCFQYTEISGRQCPTGGSGGIGAPSSSIESSSIFNSGSDNEIIFAVS